MTESYFGREKEWNEARVDEPFTPDWSWIERIQWTDFEIAPTVRSIGNWVAIAVTALSSVIDSPPSLPPTSLADLYIDWLMFCFVCWFSYQRNRRWNNPTETIGLNLISFDQLIRNRFSKSVDQQLRQQWYIFLYIYQFFLWYLLYFLASGGKGNKWRFVCLVVSWRLSFASARVARKGWRLNASDFRPVMEDSMERGCIHAQPLFAIALFFPSLFSFLLLFLKYIYIYIYIYMFFLLGSYFIGHWQHRLQTLKAVVDFPEEGHSQSLQRPINGQSWAGVAV